MLQESPQSDTLKQIWQMLISLIFWANARVDDLAETIIVIYFRIFANQFNNSPAALASARIVAVLLVALIIFIFFDNLMDSYYDFIEPVVVHPSLDGKKRKSSAAQLRILTKWVIFSFVALWLVAHLMSRLLLPIDVILNMLAPR